MNVNFCLPLTKKIDNYEVMVNNYNVILCKKLYTPFTFVSEEKQEYVIDKRKYTDNQLKINAENEFKPNRVLTKAEAIELCYKLIKQLESDNMTDIK